MPLAKKSFKKLSFNGSKVESSFYHFSQANLCHVGKSLFLNSTS